MKSNTNISQAQELLDRLTKSYIEELSDRVNDLEMLVLGLREPERTISVYGELFRKVHSMKGSSGTHGIQILSIICHHFEDYLESLGLGEGASADSGQDIGVIVNNALRYIDLIQLACETLQAGGDDFSDIEKSVFVIHSELFRGTIAGLIADNSPLTKSLCDDILSGLQVKLDYIDDSLLALERLSMFKYDFLIIGKSLKGLGGLSVFSALRLSGSPNRNIKVIMLSSDNQLTFSLANKDIDFVVKRDADFAQNLAVAVGQISANA